MKRRQFLKQSVAAAAVGAVNPSFALANARPKLVTGKNENYVELVRQSIAKLGGISQFVKKGETVVVKPNIGWDRKPEHAANTHPDVVKTLVQLALEADAGKVLVFDRTCNEARRCYKNSGIGPAVESIGDKRVKINHVSDRHFIDTKIPKGKKLTQWPIHKEILNADCIINVPVAKHHGLSDLSLGLKNSMGVLGGNRGMLHVNLGQKLADLATVVKPRLTVIDATRMLLRHGPQGGRLDDVHVAHTLVTSADPIAADAFATTLFGIKADSIESTRKGFEAGLGEMEINNMDVIRLN